MRMPQMSTTGAEKCVQQGNPKKTIQQPIQAIQQIF